MKLLFFQLFRGSGMLDMLMWNRRQEEWDLGTISKTELDLRSSILKEICAWACHLGIVLLERQKNIKAWLGMVAEGKAEDKSRCTVVKMILLTVIAVISTALKSCQQWIRKNTCTGNKLKYCTVNKLWKSYPCSDNLETVSTGKELHSFRGRVSEV